MSIFETEAESNLKWALITDTPPTAPGMCSRCGDDGACGDGCDVTPHGLALMRLAATILEKVNILYGQDTTRRKWSPAELRYEADYLGRQR